MIFSDATARFVYGLVFFFVCLPTEVGPSTPGAFGNPNGGNAFSFRE